MRPLATRLTLLASAVCILAAVMALYARSAIVDRGQFANRAVQALGQDEVTDEIATRFATDLINASPELVTLQPALEMAAADVTTSPWFATRFATGMREIHRGIFSADPRPSLRVPGMTARVQAALARRTRTLTPRLGAADPSLMSIGGNGRERLLLDAAGPARAASRLAPFALVLGLSGLLLVALTARDRRRGVWLSGLALAGSGGVLMAGWIGARTLTLEGFDTGWGDAVVKTIWNAYLGDLRTLSLGLGGAGIVIAAGAARPQAHARPSWSGLPAPLRGLVLLATGAVVLADRDLALDLAAVGTGGVLLYVGARHLLAGRTGLTLAGAALVSLAALAIATSRPDPVPEAAAAPVARASGGSERRATPRPRRDPRARAAGRAAWGG